MAKAMANTELCKGCRLCVGVCPKNAIIPLETVNMNCALAVGCATRFARIMSSRWSEKGELT